MRSRRRHVPQTLCARCIQGSSFFLRGASPPRAAPSWRASGAQVHPAAAAQLCGERIFSRQAVVYRHGVQKAQKGRMPVPREPGLPGGAGRWGGLAEPPHGGLAMPRAGGDVRCAVRHRRSPRGVAIRRAHVVIYNCEDVCGLSFTSAHGGQASTQARGICYCVLDSCEPTFSASASPPSSTSFSSSSSSPGMRWALVFCRVVVEWSSAGCRESRAVHRMKVQLYTALGAPSSRACLPRAGLRAAEI